MSWGNTDDAANSPFWGVAGYKSTANTVTQAEFYNNNLKDANTQVEYIPGMTVGAFGVDTDEMQVARNTRSPRPAHAGWVVVKEGSGGRAGRVQIETLVAMSSITGDGNDDDIFNDVYINILTQPVSASGEAAENDVVEFTVVAETLPDSAAITYQWQTGDGEEFVNIVDDTDFSGSNTDTLEVNANTASNTFLRVVLSASAADDVVSDTVQLTIT